MITGCKGFQTVTLFTNTIIANNELCNVESSEIIVEH